MPAVATFFPLATPASVVAEAAAKANQRICINLEGQTAICAEQPRPDFHPFGAYTRDQQRFLAAQGKAA